MSCRLSNFKLLENIARMALEQYVEYFDLLCCHLCSLFSTSTLFDNSNLIWMLLPTLEFPFWAIALILKFGLELTQIRVSQFPFLVFCQVKMDAYDT